MLQPTHVIVKINSARNVIGKTKHGSDVFCTAYFHNEKIHTSTIDSVTSPQWNEECEFQLFGDERVTLQNLIIVVCHRTRFGFEFLGQTQIELNNLQHSSIIPSKWYKLHSKPGKVDKERGDINIGLHFTTKRTSTNMMNSSNYGSSWSINSKKSRFISGKLKNFGEKIRGKTQRNSMIENGNNSLKTSSIDRTKENPSSNIKLRHSIMEEMNGKTMGQIETENTNHDFARFLPRDNISMTSSFGSLNSIIIDNDDFQRTIDEEKRKAKERMKTTTSVKSRKKHLTSSSESETEKSRRPNRPSHGGGKHSATNILKAAKRKLTITSTNHREVGNSATSSTPTDVDNYQTSASSRNTSNLPSPTNNNNSINNMTHDLLATHKTSMKKDKAELEKNSATVERDPFDVISTDDIRSEVELRHKRMNSSFRNELISYHNQQQEEQLQLWQNRIADQQQSAITHLCARKDDDDDIKSLSEDDDYQEEIHKKIVRENSNVPKEKIIENKKNHKIIIDGVTKTSSSTDVIHSEKSENIFEDQSISSSPSLLPSSSSCDIRDEKIERKKTLDEIENVLMKETDEIIRRSGSIRSNCSSSFRTSIIDDNAATNSRMSFSRYGSMRSSFRRKLIPQADLLDDLETMSTNDPSFSEDEKTNGMLPPLPPTSISKSIPTPIHDGGNHTSSNYSVDSGTSVNNKPVDLPDIVSDQVKNRDLIIGNISREDFYGIHIEKEDERRLQQLTRKELDELIIYQQNGLNEKQNRIDDLNAYIDQITLKILSLDPNLLATSKIETAKLSSMKMDDGNFERKSNSFKKGKKNISEKFRAISIKKNPQNADNAPASLQGEHINDPAPASAEDHPPASANDTTPES
ncbi:hypothetical protein SNEBB_006493 [Seison nebaliae]|nr:hypothetical protein SNEBB_006493 [Seison nebaliae]